MSKKKQQGHYCRFFGRYRANEKFSGKGHRQHICKDCNRDQQAQKREKKHATYEGKQGIGFLFDMETIIAVYQYSQTDDSNSE